METMSIGEAARRAELQPSAIRYYESVGLLPEPRRAHGRRQYGPDVLTRLTVIRMAQDAGFTIAEVRALFHSFPEDTAASVRWRAFAATKATEMDAIIARAQRMRGVLEESMRCGCVTFDDCALVGWRRDDDEACETALSSVPRLSRALMISRRSSKRDGAE